MEEFAGPEPILLDKKGNMVLSEDQERVIKLSGGADDCVLDSCKDIFGLHMLNMEQIAVGDTDCIVMDFFENRGRMPSKPSGKMLAKYLKENLVRGIFRSGCNLSNILVNGTKICSIGKVMIGGKKTILDKNFPYAKYTPVIVESVFSDIMDSPEEKRRVISENLERYGFGHYTDTALSNFDTLKKDFDNEFFLYYTENSTKMVRKSSSEMKTSLEQCVKDGLFESGMKHMVDLDLSNEATRSSLRNRLVTMVGKYIGPGDPNLWLSFDSLIQEWEHRRVSDFSSRVYLSTFFKLLCHTEKSTFINDIKEIAPEELEKPEGSPKGYYVRGDTSEAKDLINNIVCCLESKNDQVYRYVLSALDFKSFGMRNRRKRGVWTVFWILNKFITNRKVDYRLAQLIKTCSSWVELYNSKNEYWVWVAGCIWFVLHWDSPKVWATQYAPPNLFSEKFVNVFYSNSSKV